MSSTDYEDSAHAFLFRYPQRVADDVGAFSTVRRTHE
jgi:hypothetical protein